MYLGIDLGTSEVKAVLIDDTGSIVGSAGAPLQVSRPQPRWSEQDPADWWSATNAAIHSLRKQCFAHFPLVRGIGLSGQMHGAVLLDGTDQVLRPAILWNDLRSDAECVELTQRAPALHDIAGNLAMPGFTAPKLLWVRKHESQTFERTATVLLPKDYLRLLMTGEKVSDPSDAAGTLWLDVARRDWSDELLQASDLSRSHMPRLVEGSEASGTLLPSVASAWGLSSDVVVAGGGGDNAASAVGVGAVKPGDGFLSLGTSGVLFVVNDRYRPNPASAVHAFCHALPQRWHQMSVMLSAASCLKWACGITGAASEAALLEEVARLPAAALKDAPLFLPYLSGERTPHNDPHAKGVLFDLGHDTSRAHIGYAVLEGVAFGMADGLDALRAAGTNAGMLSLVGGGSRSAYWAQLIADALNVPTCTHQGSEAGAALGAARLGWIAAGGDEDAICTKPPIAAIHEPNAAAHETLQPRLARFRNLYRQLKPVFASR